MKSVDYDERIAAVYSTGRVLPSHSIERWLDAVAARPVVDTTDRPVNAVADDIAAWVRAVLR